MEINNGDGKAKIIAYYLPQFYPTEFNNTWYGKGYTEWTNVGKAKPLFKEHYQPRVPADLGYYDLRLPEIAEAQAELAREAGVFGFGYWHYWWAGKKLLEKPSERMLASGRPDFPFCFCWANESWYKKMWNKDKKGDKLIMEQTYPGEVDNEEHFYYCAPFFQDRRYLRYDDRPLFMIYRPLAFHDLNRFILQWNSLVKKEGIADSFYFIAYVDNKHEKETLRKIKNVDCFTFEPFGQRIGKDNTNSFMHLIHGVERRIKMACGYPNIINYNNVVKNLWVDKYDSLENVAPILIPQWDHTPRSGRRGTVFVDCTPERWEQVCHSVLSKVRFKKNKMVFLKSWNEWGEGNYMEPDLKYGKSFIEALGRQVASNKEATASDNL